MTCIGLGPCLVATPGIYLGHYDVPEVFKLRPWTWISGWSYDPCLFRGFAAARTGRTTMIAPSPG